tara:strand:+ start:9376 stop:12108 length:2733 start_codon:yes stop_codon:yes gene_type:complete
MIRNKYKMGGYPYRVGGPRRRIPAWASKKYFLGGVMGAIAGKNKKGLGLPFREGGYYQGGGMYGSPNAGNSLSGVQESRAADQQALSQYMGDSSWQNKFWNEQTQKQQMQQQMGQAATDAASAGLGALSGGQATPGGGAGSSAAGGLATAAGDYMQMMGGDNDPTTITGKEKTGAMLSGAGSGAMQGAQMGSALGPMGSLAGGVIGGVAGLIGGKKKQEKEQEEAKKQLGDRNQAMIGAAQQMHARRQEGMEDMGSAGFRRGGMKYGMGGRMAYPMAKQGLQMGGFAGPPMPLRSGGLSPMSYPANFSMGGGPANHSKGGYYQKGGWSTGEMYSRPTEAPILSSFEKPLQESGNAVGEFMNNAGSAMKETWQSDMSLGDKLQTIGDVASFAPNPFISAAGMITSSAISGGRGVRDIAQGNYGEGLKQIGQAGLGVVPIASQLSKVNKVNKLVKGTKTLANINRINTINKPVSKTVKVLKNTIGDKSLVQQTAQNMQQPTTNAPGPLLAVDQPTGPMPSQADIKKTLGPIQKPDISAPSNTLPKITHTAPVAPKMPLVKKGPIGPKNKPNLKTQGKGSSNKPLIGKLPINKPAGGGKSKGPLVNLKKPASGGGGKKPLIKLPKPGSGGGKKPLANLKLPKLSGSGGGGGLSKLKDKVTGGGGGGLALGDKLIDIIPGKAQMGGFHNMGSRILGSMRYDKEFRQKQRDLDKEFSEKQKEKRKEARSDRKEKRALRKSGRQERRQLRKSQRQDRKFARRGKYQDGGFNTAEHEYKMSKLNSLSSKLENFQQAREIKDMEDRILAEQGVSKLQEGYRKGGTKKESKEFEMYAKMLNQLDAEQKDKAASYMYVYDGKGRPVLPGQVPMITPGMIKKNLEKNQWLRMRYEAMKDNKKDGLGGNPLTSWMVGKQYKN